MKSAHVYLHFHGQCREAMTFYGETFKAQPNFTAYSSGPPEIAETSKDAPDRILHAELTSGPFTLMASDFPPGAPFNEGRNFAISIDCSDEPELRRLFDTFAENGTVTMPLHDAFWGGKFGMVTDKWAIGWMFSLRTDR